MIEKLPQEKLPQAMLWFGPRQAYLKDNAYKYISLLICAQKNTNGACGHCRFCIMLAQGSYPDLSVISPETNSVNIKIDQIRDLQQAIFHTPKIGKQCFIVIEPADKMNHAAANALLKILEEPPSHAIFILIAEQINLLPATIISRCHKYNFYSDSLDLTNYKTDDARSLLLKNFDSIGLELCSFIENKISLPTLVKNWSNYEFTDILWLLYLITAKTIEYRLVKRNVSKACEKLAHLKPQIIKLFRQLDEINAIMHKVNRNLNINQTLFLENLLIKYA